MIEQPLVSIVMPVFKSKWFDIALGSAIAQTIQNIEILIGDDSFDDTIKNIVQNWNDPRIKYIKNADADRGFMNNLNHLIDTAKGKYIKFLWDDDLLLPKSLQILTDILENSDAKLAFHQRYRIDEQGFIIDAPCSIGGSGILEMTPEYFFGHVIKYDYNLLGEPSNFMVETKSIQNMPDRFDINGICNVYYTDLVLFVNYYRYGYKIIGSSEFGSGFRSNAQQGMNSNSPVYSAKFFEREFLRRWCAELGLLSHEEFIFGITNRILQYESHNHKYPEFTQLALLNKLPVKEGKYLPDIYIKAIKSAYNAVAGRIAKRN